jgi:hypothetical protein
VTRRVVHFAPGLDPLRAACGSTGGYPLRFAPTPAHVTCRGRCAVAARKAAEEIRALALRAVGGKVVFLDFDGVLNHVAFYQGQLREERAANPPGAPPVPPFDRACVARLNDLLTAAGALVAVSSSWRTGSSIVRLTDLLGRRGFTGTIIGITPEIGDRGKEIQAWLNTLPAPPAAFVVLDDDGGGWMDPVQDRLVQTDFMAGGLTEGKVNEALKMLGVCPCEGESDDTGPHIQACRWSDPSYSEGMPL